MKTNEEKEIPILRGVRVHSKKCCLEIYCEHCQATHTHSWTGERGDPDACTHRVAHCYDPKGPYWMSGYYIALTAEEQERVRREKEEKAA